MAPRGFESSPSRIKGDSPNTINLGHEEPRMKPNHGVFDHLSVNNFSVYVPLIINTN